MQLLIVLAAALACAAAEAQVSGFGYSTVTGYPQVGYPVGYTGVYPHTGYTGVSPLTYSAASTGYPFGYSGVYPGYTGVYPGYTGVFPTGVHIGEGKTRTRREAGVVPASTTKLDTVHHVAYPYPAPVAYAAPHAYPYGAPHAYPHTVPIAYSAYPAVAPISKTVDYKTYSPIAYTAPFYGHGLNYGYGGSPVVTY